MIIYSNELDKKTWLWETFSYNYFNYKTMSKETISKALAFCGKDETEILTLIKSQYTEWYIFADAKREELTANYELYKNTKEEDGDIGDELTYSTVNAIVARSISEEFRVEFEESVDIDKKIIDNLNNVLEQDYDNDDMLVVDIYGNLYKNIMGVYIKLFVEWDWKNKTGKYNYVDPRLWIPDPNGDYLSGNYAYSGFETFVGEYALDRNWENVDELKPMNGSYGSASLQKYKDQIIAGLGSASLNAVDNPYYDIYHHYFYLYNEDGEAKKAYAILGNDRWELLHLELIEIEWVEDPEFPFSFEFFGAEFNNPFWDNVVNHTAEPQKIKALMRELRVKKSKLEVFPMWFYNEKYLDKNKLSFGFNKFIPVSTKEDWPINLDSIITQFKPDPRADNSYIVDNDLDKQVERALSIGANIQGSTQDKMDSTATEAQIIQTNSDINIAYREKIANIGKKQFVRVWKQVYIKYFAEADKKMIMMYDWVGATPIELTRKDFITNASLRIKIRSRTQMEIQRKKEQQALTALVNLILSSDLVDNYQKKLLIKDYAEALGYSKHKIESRLWADPEEELIKAENQILDKTYIDINPTDNHLMHIILQKPRENSSVDQIAHWNAHIQNWIVEGKQVNSQANGTQQAIQASSASSNIAQMNQKQAQVSTTNQ